MDLYYPKACQCQSIFIECCFAVLVSTMYDVAEKEKVMISDIPH